MEIEIIKGLQSIGSEFLDYIFTAITRMGEESFFFIIFLAIYWCYSKEFAFKFGFFYIISYFFNNLFKKIIKRARPYEADSTIINKLSASCSSFPSGHMQGFSFQAAYIGMEFNGKLKDKKQKITMWSVFGVLAVLLAISRMYLGQHYISDILAGLLIGGLLAYIFVLIVDLFPTKLKKYFNLRTFIYAFMGIAAIVFVLLTVVDLPISESTQILFYKFVGGYLGISIGYLLDNRYLHWTMKHKGKAIFIKCLLGYSVIICIYYFLNKVLPLTPIIYSLMFFIYGIISALVLPFIFKSMWDKDDEN